MNKEALCIQTPGGLLKARVNNDPDYPGIEIILEDAKGVETSLALVEHIPGGESDDRIEGDIIPNERVMYDSIKLWSGHTTDCPVLTEGFMARVWNDGKRETPVSIAYVNLDGQTSRAIREKRVKIRIPKDAEYLTLCDVTNGKDCLMHWEDMYCWVDDSDNPLSFNHTKYRAARGSFSARCWNGYLTGKQYGSIGFRPVIQGLDTDSLAPDENGLVVLGTLYMAGEPVKIPQNPKWGGDITDYIPDATLEMRDPLDDPDYQVKGYVVGKAVAIADRVLLKNITCEDIENAINKEEGK